ncbi:MAG: hypothetical protein C0473_04535 [Cyanobacteria bacterium DS3.002]|nr:hypothetical protein [Cyanobacteria bacterium DS3.002]MBA4076085.1 hypothetical protein [Cyanobacteria bacterium PR.023]
MLNTKLENLLTNSFAFLLFIFCLSKFGANIEHTLQCGDTAWLIKTGQYILAHGIPATDCFSFTCPDRPIVIYQWLFTIALGALFQLGGLWLVGIAAGIVTALIYLYYLPVTMIRQGVKPIYVFGLLSLVCSPIFFWARPQLMSFLLIAVFTIVLERFRNHGYNKSLWILPPIMVLWANTHSFWFIGLAMVATYLLIELAQKQCQDRKKLLTLLFACIGAVLVNPYSWGLITYNLSFTTEPDFGSIRELQPILLTHPRFFIDHLLYLTLAWLAILRGHRAVPLSGLILAAVASIAALMFYRFVPVAILLTWPYMGLALSRMTIFNSKQTKVSKLATSGFAAIAISCAVFSFLQRFPPGQPVWFTNSDTNLETTIFLKQHPTLTKNMFCDPAIGNSLIFENLSPVFIDTRFDFYGRKFCTEYNNCFNAEEGWQSYLAKWQVSSLCVDDSYQIYQALLSSPDWLLVFDDQHFSVWLPNNEAGEKKRRELVTSMGGQGLSNLALKRRQEMPEQLCRKHTLTAIFYLSTGQKQLALQEAESGLNWSKQGKLAAFLERLKKQLREN